MSPDLRSLRARKARIAHHIGETGYGVLVALAIMLAGLAAVLLYEEIKTGYFAVSGALLAIMLAAWYRLDLSRLPTLGSEVADRLSGDILAQLKPGSTISPLSLWEALHSHYQVIFMMNHLLVSVETAKNSLSTNDKDTPHVWEVAAKLADLAKSPAIEPGHVIGALFLTSAPLQAAFRQRKLPDDAVVAVTLWLSRALKVMHADKPYFGGIGRDWASGFTPRLNQFGHNISLELERYGAHFGWLAAAPGVTAMKSAFSQGTSAVALIGEPGVGKTSYVNALAQLLLQEQKDRHLEHRQIITLNPSTILSNAQHPGDLEHIVMTLLGEAAQAGNIILFFDDASLFFKNGPGSLDITQILLPVIQSRAVQMVMAMTPHDYQALRATNPAFANQLTPVTLAEPSDHDVMRILEDAALGYEHQHKVLISYEAIREAYALSGRYQQDMAYPGKAIQLLGYSLSYVEHDMVVTALSVQRAIEQSRGIKVSAAAPAEADGLLHLEDRIHERMINQTRAVSVVANALRRARAGVANPRRPIGSFLFLGPTGVGKTELAKAIAATYFNAESNMIRLDMSEYQQPTDVRRLLSDGREDAGSLIMAVRQTPFSVVLLDEIEKAHPNILNLLLQLLDEGQITDTSGRAVSFKDCIIIATSNAGANLIREHISRGESLESFEKQFTDELITSNQFKPELLNRFDEIVLFRPLNQNELTQVVTLMVGEINQTLKAQNITVALTPAATQKIVTAGYDPRLGARPMRRALQRAVEDTIAARILSGQTKPGDHVTLDASDLPT